MSAAFFGRKRWLAVAALVLLAAGGLALRLINLDNPPLDLHAWRQLRGANIARGIYYSMLPNVDPQIRDQARYLAGTFQHQEPRIFETLLATTYLLVGGEYVWIARLYSILFWMVGGAALFGLARRLTSTDGALAALAYYLFLPYSVSHSRLFLPDLLMIPGILLALLAAYRWHLSHQWRWAVIAGLCAGFAMLVKVFAVFFIVPPVGLLVLTSFGLRRSLSDLKVWAMALIMAVIPAVYYLFFLPGGAGAGNYLATWSEPFRGLLWDIHFYIGWFHKLGQFNLTLVVLALASLPLLPREGRALAAGLWLGYLLYGLALPAPIRSHSYYSLPLVFTVALSLAGLGDLVLSALARRSWFWQAAFVMAVLLALGDSALMARKELTTDYRAEPAFWKELGEKLPIKGAYIGLSEDYNTRLQYYGWRFMREYSYAYDYDMGRLSGHEFNLQEPDFDNWQFFLGKTEGYGYFLVTMLDELDKQPYLKQILDGYYPVLERGERYILYDLAHPLKPIPVPAP